ncbi:endonuclease [Aggregicoccus sp. 17bor-14]|uniref:pre-peptidase C-terminal domain-containing protein n=1 Tax=Myxococcaceae TaxID=31 RepID=UPI00129C31AA|nr:pre-peptidase C-terminal domain-containing protein [Simulacricoccus sp. 17bor-14]MRI89629.1 endonuclease [Aggregicoccus sp. 17bor-14]
MNLQPRYVLPLLLALAACGGPEDFDAPADAVGQSEAALTTTRVRLMAANISSGNLQSYDPGEGIRIFQGVKPDVVMIQEFNYGDNSATAIRGFVNTAFGTGFSYFREAGAQIPNGVISRWPILAAGEWDDTAVTNRDFAWARIDVPGPKDLWVVSVHLLTADAATRNGEAQQLVNLIKANIPTGDYLAIAGDFNTDSRSEACLTTFSQVVSTASPYPADRNGNTNTNAARAKPYDHVLVDADLKAYQTATVIGASSFSGGLVADTRVYSPISEITPARSTDSGATNMQHMAVVKDFLIPSDTTTTPPPTGSTAITAESEDNGTAASADGRVGNGVAVSGAVGSSTDADWFSFDAKAGGSVTVSLSISGTADLDWYLYPASNTSSYLARGYTANNPETGSATLPSAGTYLVKVVGYSGATGSYSLKVTASTTVIDP